MFKNKKIFFLCFIASIFYNFTLSIDNSYGKKQIKELEEYLEKESDKK
ncbi:hypothetical protein GF385_02820, partial [Candidatus Dependentiae bacterium]|nr:hypothetical protein [Candidatus Dependentiae bacterium]